MAGTLCEKNHPDVLTLEAKQISIILTLERLKKKVISQIASP